MKATLRIRPTERQLARLVLRLRRAFLFRHPILVHRGAWQRAAMRRERVTEEEVLAALRSQDRKVMDVNTTVVIETGRSLSVLIGQPSG